MASKDYKCGTCGRIVTYDEYSHPPGECGCGGWFYPC
jgi:DNA-directed RNA polymerase subunit RPC12/RpoP